MKSLNTGRTTVALGLLGVTFLLLLAPLGLSQTPRSRFSRFPPRISRGNPNINSRLGRNVPILEVPTDLLDPVTLNAPFAVVQGTVYDASGKPAEKTAVLIKGLDTNRSYRVVTDKNGQFIQSGVPAGEYLLQVEYMSKVGLDRIIPIRNGQVVESFFDLKFFSETSLGTDLTAIRNVARNNGPNSDIEQVNASNELLKIYLRAKEAMQHGNFEIAVPLLKELVEKAPDEALFWRRLGECQIELNNFNEALTAFTRAMALKPAVADYPGLIALSHLFIGNLQEAERYTEKTAALDKLAGAEAYYNLGLGLTDAGEAVRAETAFARATELNDSHPGAFYQLGITLLSTHPNLNDAKGPLERFLKLAPVGEDAMTAEGLIAEIDSAARKGK